MADDHAPHDSELLNPELYVNRDLSWLAFNQRVLDQAQDASWPLLERLKFLAIFGSNLDEFFMIRSEALRVRTFAARCSQCSPRSRSTPCTRSRSCRISRSRSPSRLKIRTLASVASRA